MIEIDDRLKHIAFIMDGNGRWAKKRGMPRYYGHKYGAKKFREILEYCLDIGVKVTTVYAFSTENWSRPQKEVDAIMKILDSYLDECYEKKDGYDVHYRFIGDMTLFSIRKDVQLLREDSTGRVVIHHLDLTKADITQSPFYNLQQNDILYVRPTKSKVHSNTFNSNTSMWTSIVSIALTILSTCIIVYY